MKKLTFLFSFLLLAFTSFSQVYIGSDGKVHSALTGGAIGNLNETSFSTDTTTFKQGWAKLGSVVYYYDGYWKPFSNANSVDSLYQPLDKSLYQMGNYYNKLYAQRSRISQLKWLTWGDSYAEKISVSILDIVKNETGGNVTSAYLSGNYAGTTKNLTVGNVTDSTGDFKTWVSGLTTTFTAGGSRTYGSGGVTFANTNKITVFYVKEPSAGTFKLQVNGVDAAGFTNVSCAGAFGNLGIATITQPSIASTLTFVNLTGVTRIIGVALEDTTINGVSVINVSQGGINFGGGSATITGYPVTSYPASLSNFNQFLSYVKPDVFTHEMKENSSYYKVGLNTFFGAINSNLINTDVVLIGSTPVMPGDADQVLQNTILRNFADSIGYKYWDSYRLFGSFAKLAQLGWQGDSVHVNVKADYFRGKRMLDDLGITNIDVLANSSTNITNKITNTSTLTMQAKSGSAYALKMVAEPLFGLDVNITATRNVNWYDTIGNLIHSNVFSGGNFPIIQNGSQIGNNNVRLQGSYNTLSLYNANSAVSAHVAVATVVYAISSTTSSTGTTSIDFTGAGLITLNMSSNVGTIAFVTTSGSEKLILRIKQDSTGGRTIGTWPNNIKFTGGVVPVLSTSPTAVDIFEFRTDGIGNVYEVGRYIQDFASNITTTNLTTNSVPFIGASGVLLEDNSNLTWNNANKRLGIGTNVPLSNFHVKGTGNSGLVRLEATSVSGYASLDLYGSDGGYKGGLNYGNPSTGGIFTDKISFVTNNRDFNISTNNGTSTALSITSAGAITASGSITAPSFIRSGGTAAQFLKADGSVDASVYAINPLTTTGDIVYSSSGSTAARLPIGNANQVLTVSGGVPSWQTAPTSGTYTPTLTNTLNVSSSSIGDAYYTRVGNIVHVGLSVGITPTAASGTTQLTVTLPIASSLSSGGAGNVVGSTATNATGFVQVSSTTTMLVTFVSTVNTASSYFVQFDYSL